MSACLLNRSLCYTQVHRALYTVYRQVSLSLFSYSSFLIPLTVRKVFALVGSASFPQTPLRFKRRREERTHIYIIVIVVSSSMMRQHGRIWAAALLLALSSSSITAPASAYPGRPVKKKFEWKEVEHFIAFGDSYTYVQGTHGHTNYSFIGDYVNFAFSPQELLGNMIVQNQTGTAEGGPNWVEHLTHCGLQPGLTSPLSCDLQLWDFAYGGADVSSAFLPRHNDYTMPLVNQTLQFTEYAQPVLSRLFPPSKALVAFWIGINDVGDSKGYTNVSFPTFYAQLVDTMFGDSVQKVYDQGYRDFLFMELPPLDRLPQNVGSANPRPNTTMVDWWDGALAARKAEFESTHEDANLFIFPANAVLNGIMDAPVEEYGIRNVTGYCHGFDQPYVDVDPAIYGCLPLSEYFWFNDGHMTSRVHEILAQEVEEFLADASL